MRSVLVSPKFPQKLYSNGLKTYKGGYKGVLLILISRGLLVHLHIICALSRQNWISNKKVIKKKTHLNQEPNSCVPCLKMITLYGHIEESSLVSDHCFHHYQHHHQQTENNNDLQFLFWIFKQNLWTYNLILIKMFISKQVVLIVTWTWLFCVAHCHVLVIKYAWNIIVRFLIMPILLDL